MRDTILNKPTFYMRRACSPLLLLVTFYMTGCAVFDEPWRKPYEGLEEKLGSIRDIADLPPSTRGEIHLGRVRQANGKYTNEDGTFENKVGDAQNCLFAFKVDPKIRRMVGWRFASRNGPAECYPNPQ